MLCAILFFFFLPSCFLSFFFLPSPKAIERPLPLVAQYTSREIGRFGLAPRSRSFLPPLAHNERRSLNFSACPPLAEADTNTTPFKQKKTRGRARTRTLVRPHATHLSAPSFLPSSSLPRAPRTKP